MRVTIREHGGEGRARVLSVGRAELAIGRSLTNDVVLTAPSVDLKHGRAFQRDDQVVVEDLDSAFGIYFGGERKREPFAVGPGEVVWIGPYDLTFGDPVDDAVPAVEVLQPDPVEVRFLEMIEARPFDDDTRSVYADWLEENGHAHAAEMVRLQIELRGIAEDDARLFEMSARLATLSQVLPIAWRRIVARPAIERCDVRFELRCPKRWDALAATSSPDVRFCGGCRKHVYYAGNVAEARVLAREGKCVAVDPAAPRSDGDLDPPRARMMMGAVVG